MMTRRLCRFFFALVWVGLFVTGNPVILRADDVLVADLRFISEEGGPDKVCFVLKPLTDPKVFSIEGENPRIVLDISNVGAWDGKPKLVVNGRFIKQVRTHLHRAEKKLRIVMDLAPSRDYTAEPIYYEGKGVYCITVSAK